jgi:glycosyltransferase involved in cell wall biosynthesis
MTFASKLRIALLSPDQDSASSTFIAAHRNYLAGNIFYYYKNWCPTCLMDYGQIASVGELIWFFIKDKILGANLTFRQQALRNSLSKNKVDVVFAEYGPVGVQALPICKQLNLPLVVIFHGFDAHERATVERYAKDYRLLFEYAHSVIAVSIYMKETLHKMGCPEAKLVWTPCGPNDRFFEIEPQSNGKHLVGVGRLTAKKSPMTTIKSFAKVLNSYPDAQLTLAGKGELLKVCQQLIKELDIEQNVHLLGNISPNNVFELFSSATAFVQHSTTAPSGDSEGTPVAILEASAASLPIVSTFHAGIPDVVLDKKTGILVNENDEVGMTKAMLEILRNPKNAQKMGAEGRKFVFENFSMNRHIGILNKILSKAAGR